MVAAIAKKTAEVEGRLQVLRAQAAAAAEEEEDEFPEYFCDSCDPEGEKASLSGWMWSKGDPDKDDGTEDFCQSCYDALHRELQADYRRTEVPAPPGVRPNSGFISDQRSQLIACRGSSG